MKTRTAVTGEGNFESANRFNDEQQKFVESRRVAGAVEQTPPASQADAKAPDLSHAKGDVAVLRRNGKDANADCQREPL